MKFKYLIIDDEPLARKLMQSHAEKVEILEESGCFGSAIEALNFLRKSPVDLLFLDIQMPELTGLDFIKSLRQPPAIILTTAYREYAVDAFELDVVDYLVKPISFERFLKSIDKFIATQPHKNVIGEEEVDSIMHIKSERKTYPISIHEILYVESLDNYVRVHLKDKTLITHENISSFEERLPTNLFVRVHRSFIININQVQSFSSEGILIAEKELPFGRAFKQLALNQLVKKNH
jgi:DNA-binding LytR/AlgR family response regulator